MTNDELFRLIGDIEVPVDVIETDTGSLRVITNYDLELFRRGLLSNPYLS